MSDAKEVVLITGEFARVRKATLMDHAVAGNARSPMERLIYLLSRQVELDGEPVSVERLLAMEMDVLDPVFKIMADWADEAKHAGNGVA